VEDGKGDGKGFKTNRVGVGGMTDGDNWVGGRLVFVAGSARVGVPGMETGVGVGTSAGTQATSPNKRIIKMESEILADDMLLLSVYETNEDSASHSPSCLG
jgi:hypothetical protein